MKRYRNVTPGRLEKVMAEAAAYADEHRDERVEIHLAAGEHTITGAMPPIPPNVTIIGPAT